MSSVSTSPQAASVFLLALPFAVQFVFSWHLLTPRNGLGLYHGDLHTASQHTYLIYMQHCFRLIRHFASNWKCVFMLSYVHVHTGIDVWLCVSPFHFVSEAKSIYTSSYLTCYVDKCLWFQFYTDPNWFIWNTRRAFVALRMWFSCADLFPGLFLQGKFKTIKFKYTSKYIHQSCVQTWTHTYSKH